MGLAARIKRLLANLVGRDRLETALDAELGVYRDEMTDVRFAKAFCRRKRDVRRCSKPAD